MKLLGLLNATPKKKPAPETEIQKVYALESMKVTIGGVEVRGHPAEATNFPDPALDEKTEPFDPNSPEVTRKGYVGAGFTIVPTGPGTGYPDIGRERPVDYAARLEAAAALPGKFGTVLPPDAQENLPAMKADDQSLENLALGKATTKALMRAGFETIGDLRAFEGDWTSLAGIGAKGAEKIVETLAAYSDAPEADDEPEAVPEAPALQVSFEGLVLASDDLKVSGLETYKTIPGRQLFEGADDDGTVIAALRLLSDYPKILVLLEDGADYVYAAHRFAERYRVPCLTSIPF